ncbi:hypothetical protein SNE40_007216 [Patella caerulea]|uniref:WAP domain-containing protein n=1 Tax=Patella caerulea TaxID=87958 RepID=A0AAN8Q7Z7_PATCE
MQFVLVFCLAVVMVSARSFDNEEHSGVCPPPSPYPGPCRFLPGINCLGDFMCSEDEKCCAESCGRICKLPETDTGIHQELMGD